MATIGISMIRVLRPYWLSHHHVVLSILSAGIHARLVVYTCFSLYLFQIVKMASSTGSDLSLGDAPMLSLSGNVALSPLQYIILHFITTVVITQYCVSLPTIYLADCGPVHIPSHRLTHGRANLGMCNLFCHHKCLSLLFTEECVKLREEWILWWLTSMSSSPN